MLPFSAYGIDEVIRRIKTLRPAKTGGTIDSKAVQSLIVALAVLITSFAFINLNFFHIRQSQNPAEDYWAVAKGYQERGEFEDAEMYYKKALEASPNFSDAYNGLGEVCRSMNLLDDAAAAFENALQTAGTDRWAAARALNNSGVVAEDQGRYEDAVYFYQQVLDIAPKHVLAWSNMGDAYRSLKNYEEAEISYSRALELNPTNALAILGLAACDEHAGRHEQAMTRIKRFLEITGTAGEQYLDKTPELRALLQKTNNGL
jgi:tetratricopeptide (TPR) repeat protein